MRKLTTFFIIFVWFTSCKDQIIEEFETTGLAPIYKNLEIGEVINSDALSLEGLTNFFLTDNKIYLLEANKGIHVIDNTDPSAPIHDQFLEVPGAIGVIPKEDVLIINSVKQMITVEEEQGIYTVISTYEKPTIIQLSDYNLPPDYKGYFECPDLSKGFPVAWEEKILNTPNCEKF